MCLAVAVAGIHTAIMWKVTFNQERVAAAVALCPATLALVFPVELLWLRL